MNSHFLSRECSHECSLILLGKHVSSLWYFKAALLLNTSRNGVVIYMGVATEFNRLIVRELMVYEDGGNGCVDVPDGPYSDCVFFNDIMEFC